LDSHFVAAARELCFFTVGVIACCATLDKSLRSAVSSLAPRSLLLFWCLGTVLIVYQAFERQSSAHFSPDGKRNVSSTSTRIITCTILAALSAKGILDHDRVRYPCTRRVAPCYCVSYRVRSTSVLLLLVPWVQLFRPHEVLVLGFDRLATGALIVSFMAQTPLRYLDHKYQGHTAAAKSGQPATSEPLMRESWSLMGGVQGFGGHDEMLLLDSDGDEAHEFWKEVVDGSLVRAA